MNKEMEANKNVPKINTDVSKNNKKKSIKNKVGDNSTPKPADSHIPHTQALIKAIEASDAVLFHDQYHDTYIAYDGKNYRIPKAKHESAEELTYEECMEIIKAAPEPKARGRKKS